MPKKEAKSKRKVARPVIRLLCTVCKRGSYATTKNPKNTTTRLELKKYCRFCRKHQLFKETK